MSSVDQQKEYWLSLVGKVIEFNEVSEQDYEFNYSPKERCRIVAVDFHPDDVVRVITDFSEFEARNILVQKNNFFDPHGQPILKWSESRIYPNNKQETLYLAQTIDNDRLLPFVIIDEDEGEKTIIIHGIKYVLVDSDEPFIMANGQKDDRFTPADVSIFKQLLRRAQS